MMAPGQHKPSLVCQEADLKKGATNDEQT
jgi:hypothetical protein